jgi:hypothetical protein
MSSGDKNFEREFDAFLNEEDSKLAALYRKLPQPEPDAKLDAAVRSMAHRALNPQLVATPRRAERRGPARWVPALGAAAGIVLAAGIAWRLGPSLHDDREYAPANDVITVRQLDTKAPSVEPPLSPAPPPVPAENAAAPAGRSAPPKLKGAPASGLGEPAATQAAPEQQKEARLAEPAANAPGAAGALSKSEAALSGPQPQAFPAPEKKVQKRASEMDAVERKQIMAAGAWQNLHDRDTGQAAHNEEKAKSLDDKAPAAPASRTEAPASTVVLQPPGAPPPPPPPAQYRVQAAPAPVAPPPPAEETRSDAARAAAKDQAIGGAAPAAAAPAAKAADEKAQRARSKDPNASLYPEHWLANIRTMLAQGRRDEALQSLAEFRRLYPDYRLPDDLRDLQ